jgi:hypothetical protein
MTAGDGFSAPFALGGFIALISVAGFLVLWYDSPRHGAWQARVRRWARRLTGRADLAWVDAPFLTAVAAVAFSVGALVTWSYGGYGCTGGGPSDLTTLVASGRAFLSGGDPFRIAACGRIGNPVPAGIASVLLDALGSLAGPAGVLLVWGSVSVAVIPLLWSLAGTEGGKATVFLLASFLYLPIVAVQVDGASLALVPVTVLLVLYLARRGWVRAAAVGGFLATGRFPALFPVLSASGRAGSRRWVAFAGALGAFAAATLATFAVYGSRFTGPVFWAQFSRSHLALNYWGFLQGEGWLTPSTSVTIVQAIVTVALVGGCWAWARSALGAAAIVLTGTVLLAQFLSFTELVFLVPVALVGIRARWWLWAIGVVASTNYLLAMRSLDWLGGPSRFSYALDLLLTALLLGLMIELLRAELRIPRPAPGPAPPVAGTS